MLLTLSSPSQSACFDQPEHMHLWILSLKKVWLWQVRELIGMDSPAAVQM